MKMKWNNERGFTLIELLAAVVIGGVIMGGVTTATIQFFKTGNEGTVKLASLDKLQNTARFFVKDAQNAYRATGTPSREWLELNYCLDEGGFDYCTPQGTAVFGEINCCQMGTVTYFICDGDEDGDVDDLCRHDECCRDLSSYPGYPCQNPSWCVDQGDSSGTVTVGWDMIADFSVDVHVGTRTKYITHMHLAAPAHAPVTDKTYSAHLRAFESCEP